MGGITQARILAPLALVAAVLALVLVVQGSGSSDSSSNAADTTTTQTTAKKPAKAKTKTKKKAARTYTVKAGDTLGGIATSTGVSVAVIEELNPGLDPTALTVGRKVKIAP